MKRIELLKNAIEQHATLINAYESITEKMRIETKPIVKLKKTITFKKSDIDILYTLFAVFLKNKDYHAAQLIKSIFEAEEFNFLFDIVQDSDYEVRNWQEICNKFGKILYDHIIDIASDKNEKRLNSFLKYILIDTLEQNHYIFGRFVEDLTNLDEVPIILHQYDRDGWIHDIVINFQYPNEILFSIITEVLINSSIDILESALSHFAHIFNPVFYSTYDEVTNWMIQKEQLLPIWLREVNHFEAWDIVYKYNDKLFSSIITQLYSEIESLDSLDIPVIQACLINNSYNEMQFISKQLEQFIPKTYNKNILKEIVSYRKYDSYEECTDLNGRGNYCKFTGLDRNLYKYATILFITSSLTTYEFNLIDFTAKYKLNLTLFHETLFSTLKLPQDNNKIDEEIVCKILQPLSSLLESDRISQSEKLLFSKSHLQKLYEEHTNIEVINKFRKPFFNYIWIIICEEIGINKSFEEYINKIIDSTRAHEFPGEDGVYTFYPYFTIKENNIRYSPLLFWASLSFISEPKRIGEKSKLNVDSTYLNINIQGCLSLQPFSLEYLKANFLTPINQLTQLNKQFKIYKQNKKNSKNKISDSIIEDLLFEMELFFQRQAEQKKFDEIVLARIEERNRIMANLSHTVKTMLSNVIDPIQKMKEDGEIKPIIFTNAIRGANLIRSLVNAMNLSFKGSIKDFIYDVQNNTYANSSSLEEMFIDSIKQAISTMFDGKYFKNFVDNYYPTKAIFIEAKRKWDDISQLNDIEKVISFLNKHLVKTTLDISKAKEYIIGDDKGSALKLLIIIQEIILNAVKYSSFVPKGSRNLHIKFDANEKDISIIVSNTFKPKVQVKSSGLGHEIIKNFSKLLQTEPIINTDNNLYSVEIRFKNIWRIDQ